MDPVDLFLYDIKLIDPELHRKHTGVSNKKIITNLRRLSEKGKKIVIRFVVIPGITDTEANLQGIVELLSSLDGVEGIDILPYHKMGSGKYKKLSLGGNPIFKIPARDRIKMVREAFLPLKVTIKTGG
jgi:pyruvate formate lyase activating enzyme